MVRRLGICANALTTYLHVPTVFWCRHIFLPAMESNWNQCTETACINYLKVFLFSMPRWCTVCGHSVGKGSNRPYLISIVSQFQTSVNETNWKIIFPNGFIKLILLSKYIGKVLTCYTVADLEAWSCDRSIRIKLKQQMGWIDKLFEGGLDSAVTT